MASRIALSSPEGIRSTNIISLKLKVFSEIRSAAHEALGQRRKFEQGDFRLGG
jgi:hypothetical protein